jgi:hypothetical protein
MRGGPNGERMDHGEIEEARVRPVDAFRTERTQAMPRVAPGASVRVAPFAPPAVPVSPTVQAMLLASEQPVFTTRPHPIVVWRPLVAAIAIGAAVAIALDLDVPRALRTAAVVGPFLAEHAHLLILIAGGAALLRAAWSVARGTGYYLGYRVTTTNRRVLVVDGVLRRTARPLPFGAMAGSTFAQSILGRILGYGTVRIGPDTIRDVRDSELLFRYVHEVANGVENGQWTPAVRQTHLP